MYPRRLGNPICSTGYRLPIIISGKPIPGSSLAAGRCELREERNQNCEQAISGRWYPSGSPNSCTATCALCRRRGSKRRNRCVVITISQLDRWRFRVACDGFGALWNTAVPAFFFSLSSSVCHLSVPICRIHQNLFSIPIVDAYDS